MNIPVQSRPVVRRRVAVTPRRAGNAVGASGDGCGTNYWCCAELGGANPRCYSCGPLWGICGTPQATFCQNLKLQISDQC